MEKELSTLLLLAGAGDEDAFADLTEMYKPLIESMGKRYAEKCTNVLYSEEDFVQEATLGFYSAVRTYKESDKVTFGLYAKVCVRNRLISLLRQSSKKPKAEKIAEESVDMLSGLTDRENLKRIEEVLSKFEWAVFCLYIERLSYLEISRRLGRSVKSVDNAIFRIKTKLKYLM